MNIVEVIASSSSALFHKSDVPVRVIEKRQSPTASKE
jgi:hypothetical protein